MWQILTLLYLLAQSNIFHYVFYAGHGWFCLCLLNAGKYTCVIMLDHFLMTWWIFSFAIVASVCSYRQRLNLPHMPLRFSHTLTNVSVLIIGTLFRFFFSFWHAYISKWLTNINVCHHQMELIRMNTITKFQLRMRDPHLLSSVFSILEIRDHLKHAFFQFLYNTSFPSSKVFCSRYWRG